MKLWKRVALVIGPALASTALLFACEVSDETAGTPRKLSGQDATTTPKGDGGGSDAPVAVPGLCGRVGGPGKVATISDQIVANAQADCRIGAYFSGLEPQRRTHVVECMRRHLQEIFSCPGVTYLGSKSSTGQECRSLENAHDNLQGPEQIQGLNKADFRAYREAATAALKAGGLSDGELASVNSVILGYEGQVAPRTIDTYNTNCTCPNGITPGQNPTSCIPDGGYVLPLPPDAAIDAPIDTGPDVAVIPDAGTD